MDVAVSGSRTYPVTRERFRAMSPERQHRVLMGGERVVHQAIEALLQRDDRLVSGMCKNSPDTWAVEKGRLMGLPDPIELPAQWLRPDGSVDRSAGFRRNADIARLGEVLLAFWDGKSNGTRDTLEKAHALGKPIVVFLGDGRVRMNPVMSGHPMHERVLKYLERVR